MSSFAQGHWLTWTTVSLASVDTLATALGGIQNLVDFGNHFMYVVDDTITSASSFASIVDDLPFPKLRSVIKVLITHGDGHIMFNDYWCAIETWHWLCTFLVWCSSTEVHILDGSWSIILNIEPNVRFGRTFRVQSAHDPCSNIKSHMKCTLYVAFADPRNSTIGCILKSKEHIAHGTAINIEHKTINMGYQHFLDLIRCTIDYGEFTKSGLVDKMSNHLIFSTWTLNFHIGIYRNVKMIWNNTLKSVLDSVKHWCVVIRWPMLQPKRNQLLRNYKARRNVSVFTVWIPKFSGLLLVFIAHLLLWSLI